MLIRDATTKEPLPEIIISVVNDARGDGIGAELLQRAQAAACPGLSLSVSEKNCAALRLYERVGFRRHGKTLSGLVTMVWRAS